MKHGIGEYKWKDKNGNIRIYYGNWMNDTISGEGKYTWDDGRVYIGEFLNDERHGDGIMIWSDGSKYTG